jgi:hypothetical protein
MRKLDPEVMDSAQEKSLEEGSTAQRPLDEVRV